MRLAFAALLAAALLLPQASAQSLPTTFEIKSVAVPPPLVPDGPAAPLVVSWEYTGTPAARGGATLFWEKPTCAAAGITIAGNATQAVAGEPGTSSYSGTSAFQVRATRQAPGEVGVKCTLTAHVEETVGGATTGNVTTSATVQVAYVGEVRAAAAVTHKVAGPQKPIPFQIEVENLGNAQTQVVFQVANKPDDRWANFIPPAPITLDSPNTPGGKSKDTATFTVNTPYRNGPNSGSQNFTLIVQAVSSRDNSKLGNSLQVAFTAGVDGMYIPGPDAALPLLLVACVAVARSVRRDPVT